MRRCPVQRPQGGDLPGSSPALPAPEAWTEARSQYCLLRPEGCAFFFGSIFSDSTIHFPGKAPPEHDCASSQGQGGSAAVLRGNSPRVFGNVWGKKEKKKKHTPFFLPSVLISQHTHQWSTPLTSFHLAKNPGKHLNSGTGRALAAGRVSLAHNTASIPWGEILDYSEQ